MLQGGSWPTLLLRTVNSKIACMFYEFLKLSKIYTYITDIDIKICDINLFWSSAARNKWDTHITREQNFDLWNFMFSAFIRRLDHRNWIMTKVRQE